MPRSVPSRRPPSVERLVGAARDRLGEREHASVTAVARAVVADERARLAGGVPPADVERLAGDLLERLAAFERPAGAGLVTVINATGVILHTNLGRAPWPRAAAMVLAVGLAGRGGGVVVSRGELVEIGGGVRIPEIVRRAGARLIEVGTTNRTRAADFAAPLEEKRARVVLRVHPSNFRQDGFVEAPDPAALSGLTRRHGAILVDDLGSGALIDTAAYGLAHEPMPSERLAAGADLVTFSGDKLLGGPQAGLIVGRADLLTRLRKDPLARAARPDKTTLAAIATTLGLYRAGLAIREIPVWRPPSSLPPLHVTRSPPAASRSEGIGSWAMP